MSVMSYSGRTLSKMWGSRWNHFEICFRSKVISTSGFYFRFRGRHLSFPCRPMSDNVDNVIFGSGILENMGVAVEIALKSVSVHKLFPLPVSTSGFVADICVSDVGRCRTMSAVSFLSRAWSQNVGVAVGIALKSVSVQKLFPLSVSTSGFVADISISDVCRCRTMSAMSYSGRADSKMWG